MPKKEREIIKKKCGKCRKNFNDGDSVAMIIPLGETRPKTEFYCISPCSRLVAEPNDYIEITRIRYGR